MAKCAKITEILPFVGNLVCTPDFIILACEVYGRKTRQVGIIGCQHDLLDMYLYHICVRCFLLILLSSKSHNCNKTYILENRHKMKNVKQASNRKSKIDQLENGKTEIYFGELRPKICCNRLIIRLPRSSKSIPHYLDLEILHLFLAPFFFHYFMLSVSTFM